MPGKSKATKATKAIKATDNATTSDRKITPRKAHKLPMKRATKKVTKEAKK